MQLMENQITALRRNGEQSAVAEGRLQVSRRVATPKNELDQLSWKSEKHLGIDVGWREMESVGFYRVGDARARASYCLRSQAETRFFGEAQRLDS